MLSLGIPFSAPQKEAMVLAFYRSVGDYLDLNSDIPGLLSAGVPDAKLIRFDWSLNGLVAGEDTSFFDAYGLGAYSNGSTVGLTTIDNSGYVRTGQAQTKQEETIQFKDVAVTDVIQQSYLLNRSGALVRMDAQDNEIRLSAGAHHNYIDGGLGVDTLILASSFSDFDLTKLASGTSVFMQEGRAVMAAINVERVKFTDKMVWLGDIFATTINGTDGDDVFEVTSVKNGVDGGKGIDTAIFAGQRTSFSITVLQDDGWAVSSAKGTNTLRHIERLQFADKTINLSIQTQAAAAPHADVNRLAELYVAFFNRVPDADGLSYWISQLGAGQSVAQIAEAFYNAGIQYASLTGFSAGMTNADFVNVIYKNVLGRSEGADAGGLAYWSGELVSGRASHGSLVTDILNSAHSFKGDATYGWVANLLDNKLTVAKTFAVDWGLNYNTAAESISQGMAIAAAVTPTGTTAALALIGVTGSELQLG
jgi:hypothetical protein